MAVAPRPVPSSRAKRRPGVPRSRSRSVPRRASASGARHTGSRTRWNDATPRRRGCRRRRTARAHPRRRTRARAAVRCTPPGLPRSTAGPRRRSAQRLRANRSCGSTQVRSGASPAAASSAARPVGPELGRDLRAHLLPRGELDDEPEVAHRHRHRRSARSRISIHSRSASQQATWANASTCRSACSSRLSTCSTLRLNSAVTPAASS